MTDTDSTGAIEAVFRIEFSRLVGGLTRRIGDVSLAEELAQDALVDALEQWPRDGTPRNPGAWLMTVAKRKAVDRFRRDRVLAAKYARIGVDPDTVDLSADLDAGDDQIVDDRLRLIFVACHPILSTPSRVALTLRLLGGLTTAEIARAYVQPEATIAQRIVRAKKSIGAANIRFEVPTGADRAARLASVLEVVYLIYNEGYSATSGGSWMRIDLCQEAVRLGRLLASLASEDAEVHGLLALMEIQSSRFGARLGPKGEPVLLLDQDRRKWDPLLIMRGLASLERAQAIGGSGVYTLQAAIAACHVRSRRADETDWALIVELYQQLADAMPSPIVELNRAVAISMASGPAAGLAHVDRVRDTGAIDRYHLLHSVRGDLLNKVGRHREARDEFELAATLTDNLPDRQLCRQRAEESVRLAEIVTPE
ncbi:MAG: hypothetical protein QOC57_2615 [Ilumatobacteraceae bacterium]